MTRLAFEKPNPLLDLLIHTDSFRRAMARLEQLSCTVKFAVLGRVPGGSELRLVNGYGVWVNG